VGLHINKVAAARDAKAAQSTTPGFPMLLRSSLSARLRAASVLLACGTVLTLAACGGSTSATPAPAPTPAPIATPSPVVVPTVDLTRSLSSYLHGLSPKLDGVAAPYTLPPSSHNVTLEHYSIPTSDGTVLDGWVHRPPGTAGQPLLLVISPYYGGGNPSLSPLGDPGSTFEEYLVPHGYAVGFISVGGTGDSGGCFRDGGKIERQQLYDAIEYMAHQTWSNGKVATAGVSYDGTTSNELFVDPPPSLATVIPMEAISDYYRYSFNNGIRRGTNSTFTTYYYPIVGLSPVGLEGGVGPTTPASYVTELSGEPCADQLTIQQESVHGTLTADKTPYWDERDAIALVRDTPTKKRPPMFFIEGYQDANVDPLMANGYLEAVKATGVPLHIWHGQWVHAYPQSTTTTDLCADKSPCRGDFYESFLLAWLDHWLLGKDTGVLDAPMVQTQGDDGVWRHETDWPPPGVTKTPFHLSADGKLQTAPTSGSSHYTDITGDNTEPTSYTSGTPVEFVSAPLTGTLRLTGEVHLETTVTADAAQGNLVATLLERKADGSQRYLSFMAINLNHVEKLASGDSDVTGKALAISENFFMQDNIVAAGSTLVLNIGGLVPTTHTTSGDSSNLLNSGPNIEPVGIGANVTLDLAKTTLTLPVNSNTTAETIGWKTQ
jgi:X-Pro dipeptidyl-peptidase